MNRPAGDGGEQLENGPGEMSLDIGRPRSHKAGAASIVIPLAGHCKPALGCWAWHWLLLNSTGGCDIALLE